MTSVAPPDNTPAARCWPEIDRLDPGLDIAVAPAGGWYPAAKALADWCLAAAILIPALPVIGVCWLLVKATSRGPGFYTQTRLGLGGREYRIIKLRTMRLDAEAGGAQWAGRKDRRVTAVGKFLRVTHFDELPQLFNVLCGQMSMVGPRPERPEIIRSKGLAGTVPGYAQRLRVKPGVTGFAQVQLPADSDVRCVRHKVAYDLFYIENAGLWFDLRLVAATVLKAAGAKPPLLRRLFLLPPRERVADVFRGRGTPGDGGSPSGRLSEFQPA